MCAWHLVALIFGFVQLLLHMVHAVHQTVGKSKDGLEQLARAASLGPMMHPLGMHGMAGVAGFAGGH